MQVLSSHCWSQRRFRAKYFSRLVGLSYERLLETMSGEKSDIRGRSRTPLRRRRDPAEPTVEEEAELLDMCGVDPEAETVEQHWWRQQVEAMSHLRARDPTMARIFRVSAIAAEASPCTLLGQEQLPLPGPPAMPPPAPANDTAQQETVIEGAVSKAALKRRPASSSTGATCKAKSSVRPPAPSASPWAVACQRAPWRQTKMEIKIEEEIAGYTAAAELALMKEQAVAEEAVSPTPVAKAVPSICHRVRLADRARETQQALAENTERAEHLRRQFGLRMRLLTLASTPRPESPPPGILRPWDPHQ